MAGEGRPGLAMLGRRDHRLSEALRPHIVSEATPGPGDLLGLELEFSVRPEGGGRVHFGSLIHHLGLDGIALDPGDPNAHRGSWGGVITADGAEAEIATPPVRTRPGFTGQLQAWARTGEGELRRAVPPGTGLEGYSAHFSAAMPAKLNDRVCRLYAETFAADLMLLTDRIDSPGLLVRPRPGRTELCGEFTDNEPLAAAAAFVAGTTRACAAAVRGHGARAALPPRLDVRLARAVQRYGWYVDRRAFGTDLHEAGRRTLLPRASGGTISAQSHLELAWAAARQALADDAAAVDLQAAEAMVTGSSPLPAERVQPDDAPGSQRGGDVRFPPDGTVVPDTPRPGTHVRPAFTLRPVVATWDFTVFEAGGRARSAYLCIPRDSLPGFIAALEEGALDEPIMAYLALTLRRRVLSAPEQTRRPGLYDQLGAPDRLLAPERDPRTGHQERGTSTAKRTMVRPGKRDGHDEEVSAKKPEPPTKPSRLRRVIAIAAAVAIVVAGAAAAALSREHRGPPVQPATLVSFLPTALVFPAVQVNTSITRSFTMTNNSSGPATITRTSIGGPSQHDFSITSSDLLTAFHGGQAVHPATPALACHRRVLPAQTCTITVAFTPSAFGSRTADLRIYLASVERPWNITLSGTSTVTPPPPSSSVSVTGVSPARGPTAGGTSVTITGSGFTAPTADTGVSFGNAAAAKFTVDSGTQITATSPPGTGTVQITVTTPAGTSAATTAGRYTYVPAGPKVTSVAPASGPVGGGTSVVITGSGFTGATGVSFGSTAATNVTVNSTGTQITATSPAGTGTVDITVTTPAGTSALTTAGQYVYVITGPTVPTVTSVTPASGPVGGGTSVVITGSGFTGATGVSFGGTPATTFTVDSGVTVGSTGTRITAASPASTAPGTVDITVTTPAGTSAATTAGQYTYVTPPAIVELKPSDGSMTGGTKVIIRGSGFTGATSVTFGGTAATNFTVDSAEQITATTPPSTITGLVPVTVVTAGGSSPPTHIEFRYTPPPPPFVTGVAPASGPAAGGTVVTISGTGFTGATGVSFGGTAATNVTVNSTGTMITATSPAGSGTVDITVTSPAGTSVFATADQFTYT